MYIRIIIIMSPRQHGYPWPSLATSPYHSSPPASLQGYILCPRIVAVCMFVLVVLLLHGHMWGSTGVHRLWARPCFSSSVLRVWLHTHKAYTCTHIQIQTYTHTHTHTRTHTRINTYIYKHKLLYTHIHRHTYTHTQIHIQTHIHMHTYTYTNTHINKQIHTKQKQNRIIKKKKVSCSHWVYAKLYPMSLTSDQVSASLAKKLAGFSIF